ncbi:MAG TPA: spirocyclase AveC family protein [Pseudonocardia sp.]
MHTTPAPEARTTPPPRGATPPVVLWAWVGALFVLLNVWIYGRWLAAGPEPITRFRDASHSGLSLVNAIQVLFVVLTIAMVTVVGRQCLRQRRLTLEAMVIIGFLSQCWTEQLFNYYRPGVLFNSNLINLSSIAPYIPGQVAPYANLTALPVLYTFCSNTAAMPLVAFAGSWLTRKIRRDRPELAGTKLVILLVVIYTALDLAFEIPLTHAGIYAYPSGWHTLTLFAGHYYQLPLFHLMLNVYWFGAYAMLHAFRNDRGETLSERGAGRIRGKRTRWLVRQLSIIAAFNLVSMVYFTTIQIEVMSAAKTPPLPSYLIAGWCGDQGQPYGPCPAPGVPIPTRADGGDPPSPAQIYARFPYFTTPAGGGGR